LTGVLIPSYPKLLFLNAILIPRACFTKTKIKGGSYNFHLKFITFSRIGSDSEGYLDESKEKSSGGYSDIILHFCQKLWKVLRNSTCTIFVVHHPRGNLKKNF